jgi:hypothetical protein
MPRPSVSEAIWKVPGSTQTGGIDALPGEYEQRVIAFSTPRSWRANEHTDGGEKHGKRPQDPPVDDWAISTE